MKFKPVVEKVENADSYKDFSKKHKDAFLIAGFFVLDFETGQHLHQIDYYVPSSKKVAAFTIDKQISMQMMDTVGSSKTPEKLESRSKIDLEALYGILEDEMKNRSITEEIKKIIAVLQVVGGKKIWNLNCVLSGMSILNAHVDDESETVLRMEKKNMMDFMRRLPTPVQQTPQPQSPGQQTQQPQPEANGADAEDGASPQEAEVQLKKLQDMAKALDKEKEALEKQLSAITSKPAKPDVVAKKSSVDKKKAQKK